MLMDRYQQAIMSFGIVTSDSYTCVPAAKSAGRLSSGNELSVSYTNRLAAS